mgnify:FL=1
MSDGLTTNNEFCNKHDCMKPCKKCKITETAEQRALRQANRIARNLGF